MAIIFTFIVTFAGSSNIYSAPLNGWNPGHFFNIIVLPVAIETLLEHLLKGIRMQDSTIQKTF